MEYFNHPKCKLRIEFPTLIKLLQDIKHMSKKIYL
jgi:hypothetical protein